MSRTANNSGRSVLEAIRTAVISDAFNRHGGDRKAVVRELGVSHRQLHIRLRALGVAPYSCEPLPVELPPLLIDLVRRHTQPAESPAADPSPAESLDTCPSTLATPSPATVRIQEAITELLRGHGPLPPHVIAGKLAISQASTLSAVNSAPQLRWVNGHVDLVPAPQTTEASRA